MRDLMNRESFDKAQEGAIGYLLAWLLGVPATVLVVIWLISGR